MIVEEDRQLCDLCHLVADKWHYERHHPEVTRMGNITWLSRDEAIYKRKRYVKPPEMFQCVKAP